MPLGFSSQFWEPLFIGRTLIKINSKQRVSEIDRLQTLFRLNEPLPEHCQSNSSFFFVRPLDATTNPVRA